MRFILKVKLREFQRTKDILKLVRKYANKTDIYREDIRMIRFDTAAKIAIIIVERNPRRSRIQIYSGFKKVGKA